MVATDIHRKTRSAAEIWRSWMAREPVLQQQSMSTQSVKESMEANMPQSNLGMISGTKPP